jgi:pimeloyl-ACP methyl ester carboxylesterase
METSLLKSNPTLRGLLLGVMLFCVGPTRTARAADGDRPPALPQPPAGGRGGPGPGGGGAGMGPGPMMFGGGGPFGGRDAVAEFLSALGEMNLSPDFSLAPEQKVKLKTARDAFKEEQSTWAAAHADDFRKIQEQMMAAFGRGGPPNAEAFKAINQARQELLSTAPDSDAAMQRMQAILSEPQRAQIQAWRDDPAHQPANPFGGGQAVTAPKGVALPADSIPAQHGFYRLKFQTQVEMPTGRKRVSMAYVLYLPEGYEASKDRLPVLVFLHGAGEAGTDGTGIFAHGPAAELQRQGLDSAFAKKFPFILICPQCPPRGERWDQPVMLKAVLALLDDVTSKTRTDPDRVYVTGLSMGGKGTWMLAMEAPARFAAIAPIAADTFDAEGAAKLRKVAAWSIVGAEDFGGAVEANQKMVAAVQTSGGDAKVTVVPGEGHFVWTRFYPDPTFYDWFLTHKRAKAD